MDGTASPARTGDPQIHNLCPSLDPQGNFCKPTAEGAVSYQSVSDRLQTVSTALFRSLLLADADAWNAFAVIIRVRLTERQRAEIAYSALMAMDDDTAMAVADVRAGLCRPNAPLPSFMHVMAEAEEWASLATDREREAYALACLELMPWDRVAALMGHLSVQRRRSAA
jgi:hypothetical protein